MVVITHAAPAHLVIASNADHLSATSILLNGHSAFRTFSTVFPCEKELVEASLFIVAAASVPWSLTFEAGLFLAVGTF